MTGHEAFKPIFCPLWGAGGGQSGQKLQFLAPQDIPDISGYQLGIGCQFVRAFKTEIPVSNQKILKIRFVSNLDIGKIIIVYPGQHHVKAQVLSFESVSKTQIKAKGITSSAL